MDDELRTQILELIKSELSIYISISDEQGYCSHNEKRIEVQLVLGDEEIATEYDTFNIES